MTQKVDNIKIEVNKWINYHKKRIMLPTIPYLDRQKIITNGLTISMEKALKMLICTKINLQVHKLIQSEHHQFPATKKL